MNTAAHVNFGTGAIGLATLDALQRRGEKARLVNRSGSARVPDGVEVIAGDASDPEYGRPAGQSLTETRPYAARITKGRLRALMAGDLMAAHRAGRVEVAIGRAGDYFGPRGGAQSNLGDR
jgi:hypothetical protein